jgi:hypothetical protein
VKQKKTSGNNPEGLSKDSEKSWKTKAVDRQCKIKAQASRIAELTQSRNAWKHKYQSLQKSPKIGSIFEGEKAAKHQYSLLLVLLLLRWQKYGQMSLRGCRHCLCELCLLLGLSVRLPSAVTLRWWICKYGYHQVSSHPTEALPYVIYVDESIVIGGEKILLVLGTLESSLSEGSLCFSKTEVLWVGSSGSWTGDEIAKVLSKIAQHYRISYVVSDCGTNLIKSYKSAGYVHIEDCTHELAKIVKKLYEGHEVFEDFSKKTKELRKRWFLSKEKSTYLPPTQRGKVRFANIFPVVNWADKMLKNWDNLPTKIQEELVFLETQRELILGLILIEKVLSKICGMLKNKAYSLANKEAIEAILSDSSEGILSPLFIEKVKEYLDILEAKRKELGRENIACCSDIIESYFGKFKAKFDNNSPKKMTEFIYMIANFGKEITEENLKEALESIKIKDIKNLRNAPKNTT